MLDSSFDRILNFVFPERKGKGYLPDFFVIFALVFLIDSVLAGLFAAGPVFKGIFFAMNVPFGAIALLISEVGDRAYLFGLQIGEFGILFIFLFIILAQSLVDLFLYERLIKKRFRPAARV